MTSRNIKPAAIGLALAALAVFSLPATAAEEGFGELGRLAARYGTDKGPAGHNYTEVYEYFFRPFKNTARNICEIGIGEGGSLKMWESYFKGAAVYGVDIAESSRYASGSIKTFVADQGDRAQLKKFADAAGREFDLLLDDGGHTMAEQQVSLGYLFPKVKYGGFYVIEDLHTSLQPDPKYGYGVNADGSNTTLKMLNGFIATGRIESEYMTREEKEYLNANLDYAVLLSRNRGGSIACLLKKKPGSYAGALLASCLDLAGEDKKEPALEACNKALYAAESAPEAGTESFQLLRSEASLASGRLLGELGRPDEARETLLWTVKNAPASWPGLAEARKLLEKYGGEPR